MRAGVDDEGIDSKTPMAKGGRLNPIDRDVEKRAKPDKSKFQPPDKTLAEKIVE